MSAPELIDLLRTITLGCWIGLALCGTSAIAFACGLLRRWKLAWIEREEEEVRRELRYNQESARRRYRDIVDKLGGVSRGRDIAAAERIAAVGGETLLGVFRRKFERRLDEADGTPLGHVVNGARASAEPLDEIDEISGRVAAESADAGSLHFIDAIAPLLGTLGTMTGAMAALSAAQPEHDIVDALGTTAAGCLVVGISFPTHFMGFSRFEKRLARKLENAAKRLLPFIVELDAELDDLASRIDMATSKVLCERRSETNSPSEVDE